MENSLYHSFIVSYGEEYMYEYTDYTHTDLMNNCYANCIRYQLHPESIHYTLWHLKAMATGYALLLFGALSNA